MNVGILHESYRVETMMNGVRDECFNLCVKDLTNNELSIDEVYCIDRCAWRYFETYRSLSGTLDRGNGPKGKK